MDTPSLSKEEIQKLSLKISMMQDDLRKHAIGWFQLLGVGEATARYFLSQCVALSPIRLSEGGEFNFSSLLSVRAANPKQSDLFASMDVLVGLLNTAASLTDGSFCFMLLPDDKSRQVTSLCKISIHSSKHYSVDGMVKSLHKVLSYILREEVKSKSQVHAERRQAIDIFRKNHSQFRVYKEKFGQDAENKEFEECGKGR